MTDTKHLQLREIIKKEYKECVLDPKHFLRKYCIIQHPLKGKIAFNLYDFQEDTLDSFMTNRFTVVLKARQIGLSTLVAGYSLWMMLFHNDQNILVIATKQDTAKNLVTKVRIMHQNLPVWLRGDCTEDNKLSLAFGNGSLIKAIASSPDAGRSEALSLLILDEGAFIEGASEIWNASYSTLATGGRGIILSTPNGMGNFFHKTWTGAVAKDNAFLPIFLDWKVHPDRDQAWRDDQTGQLGEIGARQEHDADFIASGKTVINGDLIQFHRKTHELPPKERRGFDQNIWIWEQPSQGRSYLLSADVARGDGRDHSAFHIFDLDSLTQVAEYKGKLGTKDFGAMVVHMATEYNDALLVIENSTIGWAVLQEVIDRGYKNIFHMEEDWKFMDPSHPKQRSTKRRFFERKKVAGFTTSVRTRPLIISKLDECMRDTKDGVVIRSQRTYDELEVFIWKGSRGEAMEGYNDDLVLALAIGLWVRDTALKLRLHNDDLTRRTLEHFQHKKQYDTIYQPRSPIGDPYQMHLGGPTRPNDTEDLRWLLDR